METAQRRDSWTRPELLEALDQFERILREANLRKSSVQTDVGGRKSSSGG